MNRKPKILVLTEAYPSEQNLYAMSYVHTRLKEYLKKGCDLAVLSFTATAPYVFEGISVIPLGAFDSSQEYDLIISHAPNIRHHLKFLLLYKQNIKKIVFVIHGHEVLRKNNYYPEPYPDLKGRFYTLKSALNIVYDNIKCTILSWYINKNIGEKLKIIFVSQWMMDAFLKEIKIEEKNLEEHSAVISNCIGRKFIEENFLPHANKIGDFVTIRPFDGSKYAIDIVLEIAKANPDHSFHIYGKGKFFDYNPTPKNVTVFYQYIKNDDIPHVLNQYKAALMPTKLDSQGVSMCEMAAFGIPMVVSDIPICREMMEGFENIFFINNSKPEFSANHFLESINVDGKVDKEKFSIEGTVYQEISYIESLLI